MPEANEVDVAVIGGGPAGAATAAYLAKAGIDVVVCEGARFPRPHVGESLVPSAHRVFAELGFLDVMEAAGFPRKYGAAWRVHGRGRVYSHDWTGLEGTAPRGSDVADVLFGERAQAGVDRDYTWHVDRARFDQLLLEHARGLGADVRMETRVIDVRFAPDSVHLRVEDEAGETELRARVVVDGSGRATVLGRRLGLRVTDPVFDQFALHTWFEGFDRGGDRPDYIWVHFLPETHTWLWQIPISETITSVGLVTQRALFRGAAAEREAFFDEMVSRVPAVQQRLSRAERIRPLVAEADYSYAMRQVAGDRFVLVGDAARFVDPIFSSGVSVALASARFAAADLIEGLRAGRCDASAFARYSATMQRGTSRWHRFITLYYRLNVLFTWFIQNPETRLGVLELLQGDVFGEEEPAALEAMEALVAEVEGNPDHVWHGLLENLTADRLAPGW